MRTLFSQILIVLALGLRSLEAAAHPQSDPSLLSLDLIEDADPSIRVKIFPHDRNYPPHQADAVQTSVKISSDFRCAAFDLEAGGKRGRLLRLSNRLVLNAITLKNPQMIECGSDFVVERGIGVANYRYSGKLIAYAKDGKIILVNELPVEEYLRGVVPAEVMAGWHMETLKSQAVAARTYAVYHLGYSRRYFPDREYDVDDTIAFQAYTGLSDRHVRTDQAIEDTLGQVLLYDQKLIQAYYHADSGGYTADAEHAFSHQVAYCTAKREPYDTDKFDSQWRMTMNSSEVTSRLSDRIPSAPIATIAAMRTIKLPTTGHVAHVEIELSSSEVIKIPTQDFRRRFGLGSSVFDIQRDPISNDYSFVGRGSGHGVGMNQRGAMILAADYQWDYHQILSFYYTDVEICSLSQNGVVSASNIPMRSIRQIPSCKKSA